MHVTFFPISVYLCEEKFKKLKHSITFEYLGLNHAYSAGHIFNRWQWTLKLSEWNTLKETLFGLVDDVFKAWDKKAVPSTGPSAA